MVCRRVHDRFVLTSTVFFLNVIAVSENLSMGGILIKTDGIIPPNKVLSIGLQLTDEGFVQLFGQMVWSKKISDSQFLVGIKFIDNSDHNRELLNTFLPEN